MAYHVQMTDLPGVLVLTPSVFEDDRGFFFESYADASFASATGVEPAFCQDNVSRSRRGVLRGLHYQLEPFAQGKLVRCARGAMWDVALDVTLDSHTFGRWFGIELTEENRHQLWIPSGYAHGFVALSEVTDVQYKVTAPYSPNHEASVLWSDSSIGIEWPLDEDPCVSSADARAPVLEHAVPMGCAP